MFIELLTAGDVVSHVNTDEILRVEPMAFGAGDPRCSVVMSSGPAFTVLGTVDDTLAIIAGRTPATQDVEEGTAVSTPHAFSVSELRAFAAEKGIDLGDSTIKADIRTKVIAGLNVPGLRQFAHSEGVELHGAQSRNDIVSAFNSPVSVEAAQADATIKARDDVIAVARDRQEPRDKPSTGVADTDSFTAGGSTFPMESHY